MPEPERSTARDAAVQSNDPGLVSISDQSSGDHGVPRNRAATCSGGSPASVGPHSDSTRRGAGRYKRPASRHR
ncbi:hypothetical protein FRAAL2067 [Frankia alni ACN14a]|uniref:Uncharacterized protein n=1 Tax=Frankia alni (strain DSM 45986 / CECT 9034 / ACN14a) TaxID=326424 RepID=Q0RP19_FRAAA|nr:hypothetical protein FRAAL2067 [Frankia alni ACN14a]